MVVVVVVVLAAVVVAAAVNTLRSSNLKIPKTETAKNTKARNYSELRPCAPTQHMAYQNKGFDQLAIQ